MSLLCTYLDADWWKREVWMKPGTGAAHLKQLLQDLTQYNHRGTVWEASASLRYNFGNSMIKVPCTVHSGINGAIQGDAHSIYTHGASTYQTKGTFTLTSSRTSETTAVNTF